MDKRLKELILYIAEKCERDASFGVTKLNKILFLSDFNYYGWRGSSITGADYMHKPNGPVAKRLLPAVAALVKEGRAEQKDEDYFGYTLRKVLPLKGANASDFTKEELSIVDQIIESTRHMTATELSDWTHALNPWLATTEGEKIPYESFFVLRELPVEADGVNWAKQELKRIQQLEHAA